MEENIFEVVKKQLNIKDVVRDILGEPAKSGTDDTYHSPFCAGDNDPSFKVSNDYISDFSSKSDFGTGKDIFNFIVAYNDVSHFISDKTISNFEALQWIVNRYNLDVDVPDYFDNPVKFTRKNYSNNADKLPRPYVEKQRTVSLVKSNCSTVGVWTMFDTEKFSIKPTGEEIGKIKNRITSLEMKAYDYDSVKQSFKEGKTCIPAGIKSEKDWQDKICFQQIFLIDIDNTEKIEGEKKKYYVGDEKHMTVEKILNYCEEIKLEPTFIYYTLSHSEEQNRFRLVYILDKPIQTKKDVQDIYKFLTEKFKNYNVDTAPTSIASLFLGGKEIAYESNFYYTVNKEEKTIVNYDAFDEYNKILKYTPYCIKNRKLCYKKATSKKKSTADENEEINYTEISNFIVYVDKRIQYDNGNETNTFYQVNCVVLDNPFVTLPPQLIDADKYAKGTYLLGTEWDKFAIIRSGRGNSDRLREVTQIFSKKTMVEETVYSHTGFRKINDKLCYLYHGGVVGNIENISVDLSRDNLQRYSLTDIKANTKEDKFNKAQEAIKLSYSTLDVADYSITVPLIAITYLAPLYSMLAEQDILADFVLYIQGKSGTRKSSLAAIFLSHFGNFNRDNFPCTFRDTLNALEKKAYILKDTLNIIDDYNPEIFGNGKLFTVEKVFGMYGDRTGRERMSADGSTLKKAYTARGLGIITGETIPEVAQSRIARSLILNINEHSVNLQKLSYIQDNLKLLSYAMRRYIEVIILNETKVREAIKLKFKEFMNSAVKTEHGRTAEIVATLKIGFYLFAQLLQTYEIINNEKEFNNLTQKAYECLDMLVENQSEQIKELKPTEMFFRAFDELLATKTIEVDTIVPRIQNRTMPTTNPSAVFVGYRDWQKNCYYLYPQKIYSEIVKYYKATNEKFPLNEKNLWKYLEEEGCLYRTDKSRYTVQRKIYGQNRTVVEIRLPNEKTTEVQRF